MENDEFRAFGEDLWDKVVAIDIGAFDGNEDIAGFDETRIIAQPGRIARTNKFQQFIKIHGVRSILE